MNHFLPSKAKQINWKILRSRLSKITSPRIWYWKWDLYGKKLILQRLEVSLCVRVRVCAHVSVYMSASFCVSVYVFVSLSMCAYIYVHIFICRYVCLSVILCVLVDRGVGNIPCKKKQETQRPWDRSKCGVPWEQRGFQEVGGCWSREISRTWGLRGRKSPGHVESCKV